MDFALSTAENPQGEIWIIELVLGILALFLANYGFKRIMRHIRQRSLPTAHDWKEKVDQIFSLPVQAILWIVGITYTIDLVSKRFGLVFLSEFFPPLRKAAIALCLAWILLRWKNELLQMIHAKSLKGNKRIDLSMIQVVGRIASIFIVVLTAMIVLQMFGMNMVPLIAFGGIGAAAIGFAAKDVIGNFFGGFMLYITRPFTTGDFIILSDQKIEGYVEEIGWYLTSIRDKEKRPVYLPNAAFAKSFVINSSRMSHRRIEEKIGIRYDDFSKVKSIVEEMRKTISSHPQIDTGLPVLVFFNKFEEYSLDILVDAYTTVTKWEEYLAVKQEILIKLQEILFTQGAEMAYPTEVCLSR
jgi:MscS family membrane protein